MAEKTYVSEHNYYPGRKELPAGSVFTREQWVDCGGKSSSLDEHIKKGYITENVQYVPEDASISPEPISSEEPKDEESEEEVVVKDATPKAQGIWNYTEEELVDLDIDVLNTIHKDRAAEFSIEVKRPFTSKENLIAKMTSENNNKD